MSNSEVTFDTFGLSKPVVDAISKKGFSAPSEIQAKIIPILLNEKSDIIGIASTGTGKTAAFGLPLVDMIASNNRTPKAIVLAPTRELAIQVCNEINTYKGSKKLNIIAVYGGAPISTQLRELKAGADIVVGTPGRVLDLINRKSLSLSEIDYFVLDEADEMLKMGFIDDIETILGGATNKNKRVLLFSATMPARIKSLSKKYMKDQVVVEAKKVETNKALINQIYFVVKQSEKFDALCRIIDIEHFFYGIVFCKTKMDVEDLTQNLKKAGYDADCIHGDITQSKRERILTKFRELRISILVATDVAARGIDVENLSHVINYSFPQEAETYVHRIGRTGRAGKTGTAVTFVSPREFNKLTYIENLTNTKITKEVLPNKKDIVLKKQDSFKKEIESVILSKSYNSYPEVTEELLSKYDAKEVISALIHKLNTRQGSSKKESASEDREISSGRDSRRDGRDSGRDRDNRREKNPHSSRVDVKGKTRLFIAKGKRDNLNRRTLAKFIENEANVKIQDGEDVKVFENFSFVTVPFREAEIILDAFKRKSDGGRSLVELASK